MKSGLIISTYVEKNNQNVQKVIKSLSIKTFKNFGSYASLDVPPELGINDLYFFKLYKYFTRP